MTTAPAAPQDVLLYGPDGQALTSSTPIRAAIEEPAATPAGQWTPVRTNGNATVWEKQPTTPEPKPTVHDDHAKQIAAKDQRIADLENRLANAQQRAASPAHVKEAPKDPRKGFNHWGPWLALWAAVGLTASGEFALAAFVGFPNWIAWALPVAIDVYVVQAFRRHRDVAAALILMVATNALYHLAAAGLFGVVQHAATGYAATWWLIVLVSAIAPFIVWRVHRITEQRPETAAVAASETLAETVTARVTATPAATAEPVSGEPRNSVATPQAATETAPVAAPETQPHQRETAPATRRATPRRNATPRNTRPTGTGVAAPSKLRSKDEQLAIVGPFVDGWDGPEKDLPLQPIAEALGASKATASRRVAEYRAQRTA
jgi:hypothetical protein